MRTPAAQRILGRVERSVAHVILDIELDSEPIRGRISEAGAQARSFNGWIELVQEIEDARMGVSSPPRPEGAEREKN